MPNPGSFLYKLMHRRGCTFGQRFFRLLVIEGPPLVVLEVLGSGVWKDPTLLSWFVMLSIPGTLLFVALGAGFEHAFSKANR